MPLWAHAETGDSGGVLGGAIPELPIDDYDQLRVIDILATLPELDAAEVEVVRRYEVAGACRAPILRQIDLLFPPGAVAAGSGAPKRRARRPPEPTPPPAPSGAQANPWARP